MPQHSKLIHSRQDWKNKAIRRATENREHRKQTAFHQRRIMELKTRVKELEGTIGDKKTNTRQDTNQPLI